MTKLHLDNAKNSKNDEFYTLYEDIEKEISHYDLRGMKVYCNCDTEESNFWKFFCNNYVKLGLAGLSRSGIDKDGNGSFQYYNGKSIACAGKYRDEIPLKMLEECDIVITNPPFSKFRDYMELIFESKKKFLILGFHMGMTYKDIFTKYMDNKIHYGYETPEKFIYQNYMENN